MSHTVAQLLGVTLTEIDNAASFHEEGKYQSVCAACSSTGAFEVHHAVQKQRCRRESAPIFSPDNALRLCPDCHSGHTSHGELLEVACLRDENIAFAARWLRPGAAHSYFCRYYAGSDSRIDLLLGEEITP